MAAKKSSAKKKAGSKKSPAKKSSKKSKRRPDVAPTGTAGRRPPKKTAYADTKTGRAYMEDEPEELSPHEKYMDLGEHLEELRRRIFAIIAVLTVASIGFGIFSPKLHAFLIQPYTELSEYPLILGTVYGPLEVLIRLSILAGVLVTLPVSLFIIWGYITPALERKTARIGHGAVLASAVLFWGGVLFAWNYLFPISLSMLLSTFMVEQTIPQTSIEKYYSFLFMIHMGTGIVFQLPLLNIFLGAVGILSVDWHKRSFRYILIVIFVFSAIITPPDPLSQLVLAGPLALLYFISVLIVWVIERTARKRLEAEDPAV